MKTCALIFPVRGDFISLGIKLQKYGAGLYNGWGGKHKSDDLNELATALREFKEETGGATFEFKDLEPVAVVYFYQESELVFECHVYFLHKWQGDIFATSEMGSPEEFPKRSLPFERMMVGDAQWLPRVCDESRTGILYFQVYYSKDMTELLDFKEGKPEVKSEE